MTETNPTASATAGAPRYRPVNFGVTRVNLRDGADGVRYLQADLPLGAYARRVTDFLVHWAETTPDHSFVARRAPLAGGGTGDWQHVTYGQALEAARSIGQALLNRGLSAERPVLILSENSLEHALMALGCLYAGVPYCPVTPAYATASQDYDKLRHVVSTLTPGLVYATDSARFGKALQATLDDGVEVVLNQGSIDGRTTTPFAELRATAATGKIDAAMHATGPGTIVKFLFTSGSTKLPKDRKSVV